MANREADLSPSWAPTEMRDAARVRAATTPSDTTLDEDARELLQTRTQRASLMLAAVGGAFLPYRVVEVCFGKHQGIYNNAGSMLPHLAAVMVFGAMWWVTRKTRRSGIFLRRLEAIGFTIGCAGYAAMGPGIPLHVKPETAVLLAMTLTMFGRAAYIPSSSQRTAVLGATAALPLLVSVWVTYAAFDPAQWTAIDPDYADTTTRAVQLARTANAAIWWLATTTLAALTSHVIYGLRRDIREVRRLGRYELRERLGAGGMGEVYRARHALLERPTAVKLLPLEASADRSQRFEREVQLTAQLSHPNTISIFDYGRTADGVFYYAMELVDGLTLEQLVDLDGPLPSSRVVHVLRHAAGALVEAHGVGLIHRDIKPANIMLSLPHGHGGVNEVTKVLDFGLAKDIQAVEVDGSHVDTLRGTPLYMAPEAIRTPGETDGRSDIYALGAVAYFLLTGVPVFDGNTVIEVCSQHLYEKPDEARLAEVNTPSELAALVLRCLEKSPDDRPSSALVLLAALEELPDADAWTATDAADWWREHERDATRMRDDERKPTSGVRTITVTRTMHEDRFAL